MDTALSTRMDTARSEQHAGDQCMRIADDYTAIGEHDVALTFARQAYLHYERAAALRASQSQAGQAETSPAEASQAKSSQAAAIPAQSNPAEASQADTGRVEAKSFLGGKTEAA